VLSTWRLLSSAGIGRPSATEHLGDTPDSSYYFRDRTLVISELVRQQTILYHADSRSIPDRIVSLFQSHIGPIIRGKARCNVEFVAKISISVTGEGFAFLDRLRYDPYNEGEDLKAQAIAYRRRHGHFPEVICAEPEPSHKIKPCILSASWDSFNGPRLGRPKNDPELVAAEKQQFLDDQRQRNAVEGKIGQGKRRYGLSLIREKLAVTQGSIIALNVLVMNLEKLLELFCSFCLLAATSPLQSTRHGAAIRVPEHSVQPHMNGQSPPHSGSAF
jgi:IS5 family transposase